MHSQTEKHFQDRVRYQSEALSELARRQVSGVNDIDSFLKHAVETAADVLDVERASAWLYTKDRTRIRCVDLYQRSVNQHSSGQELAETDYPSYFMALRSERTLAASDAHRDPRTTEFSDSYLTPLGIGSMLDAPLRTGGRMVGVICNEHVGKPRVWTLEEQNFAGSLSDLTSLALEAHELKQAQELLQEHSRTLEARVEERTAELRDQQARLAQTEKMAALGSLVAGIAHEINTPLGALQSNTDTMKYAIESLKNYLCACAGPGIKDSLKTVDIIDELCRVDRLATDRISHIVSTLKTFARLDRAVQDEVDIHEGLESTLILVNHQLRGGGIRIEKDYGDIPRITCFPNLLNQVFMNILVNAIQAIPEQGTIRIRTGVRASDASVFVEFKDTGIGIPEGNLRRIFDPGFTTKGVRVGTGLGLSIAYRIVADHRGRIDVRSTPGEGSTFLVVLPISQP
jgi:signal transduction histidine kinase